MQSDRVVRIDSGWEVENRCIVSRRLLRSLPILARPEDRLGTVLHCLQIEVLFVLHAEFAPWRMRIFNEEFDDDVWEFAVEAVVRARLPKPVPEGEGGHLAKALRDEPIADGFGKLANGSVVACLCDHAAIIAARAVMAVAPRVQRGWTEEFFAAMSRRELSASRQSPAILRDKCRAPSAPCGLTRPRTGTLRLAPYLRSSSSERPLEDHGAWPAVLVVFDDELAGVHFRRVAQGEMDRTGVEVPLRVSFRDAIERRGTLEPASWDTVGDGAG